VQEITWNDAQCACSTARFADGFSSTICSFFSACDSSKSNQTLVPFAIGMAVFIAHMIALPITGCSINPTRTFASSAAASGLSQCPNAWQDHWVFWFAPILGAATAGVVYEYCFHEGGYKVDMLIDQYSAKAQSILHRK
jgi:glycerol uptake facilitator-like aquaporin